MRKEFLQILIREFPNDFQLGQAVRKYNFLISKGNPSTDAEEIVLSSTFSLS